MPEQSDLEPVPPGDWQQPDDYPYADLYDAAAPTTEQTAVDAGPFPAADQTPPSEPPRLPQPEGATQHRPWRVGIASALAGLLLGGGLVAVALHDNHKSSTNGTAASATTATTQGTPQAPLTTPAGALDVKAVLAKAEPAVVSIQSNVNSRFGTGRAAGTGMLLTPDGEVLTNNHVVEGGSNIKVTIIGKGTHNAHVLGTSPADDVALVQVEGVSGLPTVALGSSGALQVGDSVVTVGNALALEGGPTVTTGIVSALNRSIDTDTGSLSNLIQTDAPINSGNSGGPLLNSSAQVVGMNTAVAGNAQNIGFAIAIDTIKPLVPTLAKGGRPSSSSASAAYLGVSLQDADQGGAQVTDVAGGTPAAKAGLSNGDVITAIDGQSLQGASDLVAAIRSHKAGDKVQLTVQRNGATRTLSVTLASRPSASG
ncbi:MAG TPA: trypsin-like peptidase domain-containing protein [Acidimicrobiales bacterium]|nr:trypsin-like peptidase domain-containing protein [Acidimicrobiales bacterium]